MAFTEIEQQRIDNGKCPYCNRPSFQDQIHTMGLGPTQVIPATQRCLYPDCEGVKGRYQGPVDHD
jgi:hypothetical protein